MPRPRSPEHDRAREIFDKHNGNIENRRIAEQLSDEFGGEVEKLEKKVAAWKSRWLKKKNVVQQSNVVQQTDKSCTTKTPENISSNISGDIFLQESTGKSKAKTNSQNPKARFGNKNAIGNKGGPGAPPKNKYAVKTKEYMKLYYDDLDDEERAFIDQDDELLARRVHNAKISCSKES